MPAKPFLIFFIVVTFLSCKVSEQNIAGTYRLKAPSRTKLVLNKDKSFAFIKNFAEPGPVFFPDSTDLNFITSGTWTVSKEGNLVLNSYLNKPGDLPVAQKDSVIAGTTITSFSFWNEYGDPVNIRFMKFPPDKTKLYKSNSIYFFAGDFGRTDTLEFHFYGYQPVKWPSNFVQNLADNYSHHVTLYEQERQGYFKNVMLQVKKKKLISTDKSFALYKSK